MTKLEQFLQQLHNDFYFKEYTYSQTDFAPAGSSQVELADNIIWLDDIFFIFQLKERAKDSTEGNATKWFESKVLKKAVSQIKNTISYLKTEKEIRLSNDKKNKFNICDAPLGKAVKIILYSCDEKNLPMDYLRRKFYISKNAGHIHLFTAEDYLWICKYL